MRLDVTASRPANPRWAGVDDPGIRCSEACLKAMLKSIGSLQLSSMPTCSVSMAYEPLRVFLPALPRLANHSCL